MTTPYSEDVRANANPQKNLRRRKRNFWFVRKSSGAASIRSNGAPFRLNWSKALDLLDAFSLREPVSTSGEPVSTSLENA
ncbi:hypothetical protein [Bradyrhizobium sp. CCBAU 53421]|uniref:hypothetical protein n=1 Tax=Bradyrhizobium sp. CCBAU 53421 TaxID=1325120 RepID=UPI00188A16A0|nr:hypothetical protein [Bradyrhizobium sp. CCBAU 53421]